MPLQIIRQDITRMDVDAIVDPTNEHFLAEGGTDAQIHLAAGPELDLETKAIGRLTVGGAAVTDAYRLPCRWIIHTAGPVWHGGEDGEKEILRECYFSCMRAALDREVRSLAFPLLSAGTYGFPRDVALRIGTDAIRDFLMEHEMDIFLVVYDPDSYAISQRLYANIQSFLSDNEVRAAQMQSITYNAPDEAESAPGRRRGITQIRPRRSAAEAAAPVMAPKPSQATPAAIPAAPCDSGARPQSLELYLRQMDESFRDMLLRKIDERGITDSACYKRANVDRKLFSKIKNQPGYHPGKPTVVAFALALELSEAETQEMLRKAGYTLSASSRFDMIIRYFIERGEYDVYEINETLFAFGQATLGSSIA
ncbi:MAG: macro domain-containing protein [Clostridia bacterium]|nr:macro domain-containing protein [Clostridia bacterium]